MVGCVYTGEVNSAGLGVGKHVKRPKPAPTVAFSAPPTVGSVVGYFDSKRLRYPVDHVEASLSGYNIG